jgi:hypothetical protein
MTPERQGLADIAAAIPGQPVAYGIDAKGPWARIGEITARARKPAAGGLPAARHDGERVMRLRDILIAMAALAIAIAVAKRPTAPVSPSAADAHKARVAADRRTLKALREEP